MITVMGATGNTGGEITRQLLAAGESVRALGRSAERLADPRLAGAETMAGDAGDAAFLTAAFREADAVYTLLPYDPTLPDYHGEQRRMGEAIVAAARAAGIPRVVALSSVGADLPSGTGFIASLHAQEQRLRGLADTSVVVLRCGWFFENFHASLDTLRGHGLVADAVAPDVPIPMIATRDIATAAAAALRERDGVGFSVRELLGERDLTFTEATRIIGERIGQPDLPYVRLPDAELIAALTAAGFAPDSAEAHVEMGRALSDGTIVSHEGRLAANTTPTRFEDYAIELAKEYDAIMTR